METSEKIKLLSNDIGVSGYESEIANMIEEYFSEFSNRVYRDTLGNVIGVKSGIGTGKKVMVAAHMDEIGLMISNVDKNGLAQFSTIGGFDPRTLLYQDVLIHSEKVLSGIIVPKEFKLKTEDITKSIPIKDLRIDIGLDKKEDVLEKVQIGDIVTIDRESISLCKSSIAGKAMDNRSCIGVLFECGEELQKYKHSLDVYFVSSVQEEVGTRGAKTSSYGIDPDIGIAVDVTFGHTSDLSDEETIEMGKGAGITIGGNMHKKLRDRIMDIAEEYALPYQIEVSPGQTGTDARAIQITRAGIPTLLIAIPLRYMHTSTEIINMKDIKSAGKLIARFISEISELELEELLCY